MRGLRLGSILLALVMPVTGCGVHRSLTIRTTPPGALVYLNGLEVGRTPVTRDFVWYGVYDVEVRKEGYETLKTTGNVRAPWWQYVPFDFFAELLPFHLHDRQHLHFGLKPSSSEAADPDVMIHRAAELREQLESSPRTRPPATTRAATRPAKRSSTTPTTTVPASTQ